ncbi:hypothetical protein MiTa_03041 [Microcystis aeruginosa NIES-4264]|nr:hypothetical protein MiHa_03658 [Microcystis aeruginosa NIES-2522]GCA89689.1 hypothetical protein MiTa_03041 [Microcystis aeruginosa NIES-4264]
MNLPAISLTICQSKSGGDSSVKSGKAMTGLAIFGFADLRYEFSFVGFLKPRPKLTFGWVQGCYSYLDSATPLLTFHP